MVESIKNDAGIIVGQRYDSESEEYLTKEEALRGGYDLDDGIRPKTEDNFPDSEVVVKKKNVTTLSDEDNFRIATEMAKELKLEEVGRNPKIVKVKTGARLAIDGRDWFLQKCFHALRLDVSPSDDPHTKKYRYYFLEPIESNNLYKDNRTYENAVFPGKRFAVNTCFLRKPSLAALSLQTRISI